jgi:uncharacterized repeat protein (TIGR03803 family)
MMALGSIAVLIASISQADAAASKFIYKFNGGSDGSNPVGGLVRDRSGNLYGTTEAGGSADICPGLQAHYPGCGTVFKLAPDGTETVLHAFRNDGVDGAYALTGLAIDRTGNLYGTTYAGGSGNGVVFEVNNAGVESVIHTFAGGADGKQPNGVIVDGAGNLYGTTPYGGGASAAGSVFKLDPSGNKTILYAFCPNGAGGGCPDGSFPMAGVIRDSHGNLYGTTYDGGGTGCAAGEGCGTVYKIAPDGTETALYAFNDMPDGAHPMAGLVMDASGNLYGTTVSGGTAGTGCASAGCGTVFKVTPGGTETVLYRFEGGNTDGAYPADSLVLDGSGNLLGTLPGGGNAGNGRIGDGIVFKIAPDGTETILAVFAGRQYGSNPQSGVLLKGATLYGTLSQGGTYPQRGGNGGIFRIKE